MADLTFDCPECSHELIVDAQAAGRVVACPECGTQIRIPDPETDPEVAASNSLVNSEAPPVEATPSGEPVPAPEMAAAMEYRVVSLIEGDNIADRITADAVEFKLNELTPEGWRLRSATTIQRADAQDKVRQELLLILERKI